MPERKEPTMKRLWNIRYAGLLVAILVLATGAAWMTRSGRAKTRSGLAQPVTGHLVTVEASGHDQPVDSWR
jgi:hypothetical protein